MTDFDDLHDAALRRAFDRARIATDHLAPEQLRVTVARLVRDLGRLGEDVSAPLAEPPRFRRP